MSTMVAPTYPELRQRLAAFMLERGEWAGVPMMIEGTQLVIEPTYPYQGLGERLDDPDTDTPTADSEFDAQGLRQGEQFINRWYSHRRQAHVFVLRTPEGRGMVVVAPERPHVRRFELLFNSFKPSWAHDIETETVAMTTLREHVSDAQFRAFFLLGQFIETSKRSGVTYVFRRARPTIAFRAGPEFSKVLAVLCMHPIAYYAESFVGAMTPTDDVLAHLLLMRGDEVMFWRRCNQHDPDAPEAGL